MGTVLASFFLGMALGSYLVARMGIRRYLSVYLLLEAVIGVCGLVLLPLLLRLDHVISVVPYLNSLPFLRFLLAGSLILVPTACMGATF
ncbi:MAG: hypothetical protein ACE5F1_10695, partial [Planctomycetota bacterium]